jgi:hypothetical protein
LLTLQKEGRLGRVGVVGLGAGTLATYAKASEEWTFFEIDPSVVRIARDQRFFTYLSRAKAPVKVELGDARLQLLKSSERFSLLIVDAFGSDAIPLHLLTKEAMQVYLDHLEADGVLAFHISNRHVNLEPVLVALAHASDPPLVCAIRNDRDHTLEEFKRTGISASVWMVLARSSDDLDPLLKLPGWQPLRSRPVIPAWTDDYSNLLRVFRWGME